MDADQHRRFEELFVEASALPRAERRAFVERACADDEVVRAEVFSMLDVEGGLDGFVSLDVDQPERIGSYLILGEFGRGGMGIVYRARDRSLEREVALKTLPDHLTDSPERRDRLRREAKLLAAVNHPNIATIFTLEEDEDRHFLTMEVIAGETLATRLHGGPLTIDDALSTMRQVAMALEAAHARDVVHRDLKPGNVMFDSESRVKVLDFGLARSVASGTHAREPVLGSAGYVSPERLEDDAVDPRVDVFAFGCILFECLTGMPTFDGDTPLERIEATQTAEVDLAQLPEETPAEIRDLIERCLAKDPDAREAKIATARRAIEQVIESRTVAALLAQIEVPDSAASVNNLPRSLTSFVGRSEQVVSLDEQLNSASLVTLTGVGGSGKSRLALEVARRRLGTHTDGVWLVQLAPVTNPELVDDEVRATLGLAEAPTLTPREQLEARLRTANVLLILDNCEHVLAAARDLVMALLTHAERLTILTTSREALGIPGEHEHVVPPLRAPTDEIATVSALEASEAVRFFVERTRAASPDFQLTESNASAVAAVCRRLDGIPLALELAAARMRTLSVGELERRLDHRFKVLTRGLEGALPRHRTLHDLIDWSYRQLDERERALLCRLSVFVGGWTLQAAESVCGFDPIEDWDVLDLLTSLIEKSLVTRDPEQTQLGGATRYRMLETVGVFARDRLADTDEGPVVEARHRSTYARFGSEESLARIRGHADESQHHTLQADVKNIIAACQSSIAREDEVTAVGAYCAIHQAVAYQGPLELAVRLGREVLGICTRPAPRARVLGSLADAERRSGATREARDHLEEKRRLLLQTGDVDDLASVLRGLGLLEEQLGQVARAREHHDAALVAFRAQRDGRGQAASLCSMGVCDRLEGRWAAANQRYEEALAISRKGDVRGEGIVLGHLGNLHRQTGQLEAAGEYLEAALAIARRLGDHDSVASLLGNLGTVYGGLGRMDLALEQHRAALTTFRETGNRPHEAIALGNLGTILQELGQFEEARASYEASLAIRRETGDRRGEAVCLSNLGWLHREHGAPEEARDCLVASVRMLRALGVYDLGDALFDLGMLEVKVGDLSAARAVLAELDDFVDGLEDGPVSDLEEQVEQLRRACTNDT